MKKIKSNIFYPRNFPSLFYSMLISETQKDICKILLINQTYFSKKSLKPYKEVISKKFNKIYFINYKRLSKQKYSNFFDQINLTEKNIFQIGKKKILHKIHRIYNIINFYSGNDGVEMFFYLRNKKIIFNFLEHGHGNLLHAYLNINDFKSLIKKFIIKTLFYLKILKVFPIHFKNYLGLIVKKDMQLTINANKILKIEKFNNLGALLKQMSSKDKIKPRINSKYVWVNLCDNSLNYVEQDFQEILNFIDLRINKKKEIVFIKHHTNKNFRIDVHTDKLISFLKLKKIRYVIFNKNLAEVPIEIYYQKFNIKKSFSFLNTSCLINAKVFKNLKNIVFLSYTLKNSNVNDYSSKIRNFYINSFKKNIKFI